MIRSIDVQFDEREFRAAYLAIANSAGAISMSGIEELRTVLGPQKYLAVKASLDPGYLALKEAAEALNIPDNKLLAAYQIIDNTNRELRDAQRTHATDRQAGAKLVQDILAARRMRIEGLVGVAEAAELLEAMNRRYQELSQASR